MQKERYERTLGAKTTKTTLNAKKKKTKQDDET